MAIIVEDGTGLTNADALILVAFFQAYCDARGLDYSAYSNTQQEQAIVRSSDYMTFGFTWRGFKLKERGHADGEQALAWPRQYVWDRNGYNIEDNIVPVEVQKATAELTFYELANPSAMRTAYTPHSRVKREQVGPLLTEYDLGSRDAAGSRPVLLAVMDLIGEFLASDIGTGLAGGAVRT